MTFPVTYIGSDDFQGGYIMCNTLADILGEGAKIYIQRRFRGCLIYRFDLEAKTEIRLQK